MREKSERAQVTMMNQPALPCPRRVFASDLQYSQTPTLVRLMGCVVAVVENKENEERFLTVDDGTASVQIACEYHPPEDAHVIGQTIDAICRRTPSGEWKAEVVVWDIQDPNAETLRRLEVMTARRNVVANDDDEYNPYAFGYPCFPPKQSDIMRMIRTSGVEGASLEDISLVLDLPPEKVQSMVHELQLQGDIYQNRKGAYVPL